jgi:hypothetical protein
MSYPITIGYKLIVSGTTIVKISKFLSDQQVDYPDKNINKEI